MGSLNMARIASEVAAGGGTAFECNVTPRMEDHDAILTLDLSGQTGGTCVVESSDDGTTWATMTDKSGNNISGSAGDAPIDFGVVLPGQIRLNPTGITAGQADLHCKAS